MIKLDLAESINKRDSILDHIFIHETEHSLTDLLKILNTNKDYSSLWFCGSRIDHNRCLGSENIGWGISALPNDFSKAKMPKYHPHQIEIMIPIYNSIYIETYNPEIGLIQTEIKQGMRDNLIIQKDVCHRIMAPDSVCPEASFFYVKPNVGEQPQDIGVKDNNNPSYGCSNCKHHKGNVNECPMFNSYLNN